jgi:hypothetical protein
MFHATGNGLARRFAVMTLLCLMAGNSAPAQFAEFFAGDSLQRDPSGVKGWTILTGEGLAVMKFSASREGYASIEVDASKDRRNVWWALIRRRISETMDLHRLSTPRHALRIETCIKVSHAPRRVNLHLNTQRTTDFHSHLMEFDIPDTTRWHTISMTTKGFDAVPGDTVYGQLALMDWGLEKYMVKVRYFKVDIVDVDSAGPDRGVQVRYHPPVPGVETFSTHLPVAEDATIDRENPDLRFNGWSGQDDGGPARILTVSGERWTILRWDFRPLAGGRVSGSGLLELTTYDLQRAPEYTKDSGLVRIVEITGGSPEWSQQDVTYSSFLQGEPLTRVFNSQMIIDVDVAGRRGDRTFATIPVPVLQRLMDGRTLGLAILPLGAVQASFYAVEHQGGKFCATLHFNLGSEGERQEPR